MKNVNEIIAEKTKKLEATKKRLQTQLKKAKEELKLAEMEQLADGNKIERLEKQIDELARKKASEISRGITSFFDTLFGNEEELKECKKDLLYYQIALIVSLIINLVLLLK